MNCSFCWYFKFDSQQVLSGRLCSNIHINSSETSCRHWRKWHREDISWGAFANWENPKTEANVCNPYVCYLSRKTARCFRLKVGHWQKLSPSLVYFLCYWETLDKGVDHRAFDAFSTCLFSAVRSSGILNLREYMSRGIPRWPFGSSYPPPNSLEYSEEFEGEKRNRTRVWTVFVCGLRSACPHSNRVL